MELDMNALPDLRSFAMTEQTVVNNIAEVLTQCTRRGAPSAAHPWTITVHLGEATVETVESALLAVKKNYEEGQRLILHTKLDIKAFVVKILVEKISPA